MIPGGNPLLQIVPLGVVLLLQQYDIEKLGYLTHLRVVFVVVQLCCASALVWIRFKIAGMPEGTKIQVPAVMQMGVEVKPAAEQSVREYDMSKWFEQMQQQVVGCIVLACVHVHWGYVTPLALQCATAPLQLLEAPLVKIHLLHKPATGSLKRPFPAPSLLPFLPPTPEPPKEKPKKDKGKKSK